MPPSSIEQLMTWSAASLRRIRPTSVLPVNDSLRTRGSCSIAETTAPERRAGSTLTTPAGTPASCEDPGHQQCGQRGVARRLQHDGAAGREGRPDLAGGHRRREVPRRDEHGDADGLLAGPRSGWRPRVPSSGRPPRARPPRRTTGRTPLRRPPRLARRRAPCRSRARSGERSPRSVRSSARRRVAGSRHASRGAVAAQSAAAASAASTAAIASSTVPSATVVSDLAGRGVEDVEPSAVGGGTCPAADEEIERKVRRAGRCRSPPQEGLSRGVSRGWRP